MNNNQNSNSNPTFYPLLTTNFKTEILKIAQRISSKRSPNLKLELLEKNVPKNYFTIGKRKVCDIIPIPKKHARKKFFQASIYIQTWQFDLV